MLNRRFLRRKPFFQPPEESALTTRDVSPYRAAPVEVRYIGWRIPWYLWTLAGLLTLLAIHARAPWMLHGRWLFVVLLALILILLVAALLWELPPAVMFCGAIVLTMFSGNWGALGLPGFPFVPDRILLAGTLLAVLLRSPGSAELPSLKVRGVHLLMAVTVLYASASGVLASTFSSQSSIFALLDRLGAIPFLMLLVAPVVFSGSRERGWLLGTIVGIGAYLGLTAIFETIGPHALVFPSYIHAQDVARGTGQAVGPFNSVVTEGFACYACAIAAIIATFQWRSGWRWFAAPVALACLLGSFLSLERGVWLGTIAGCVAVALAAREVRRWLIPAAVVCGVVATTVVIVSPSLGAAATNRYNDQLSVWDRQNQTVAALRMIEAKPLFGFGWNNYANTATGYFRLAPDRPLTGYPSTVSWAPVSGSTQSAPVNLGAVSGVLHDSYLSYAVELGLIGAALWLACVLWGLGGSILRAGSPRLRPWRLGLLALTVCFLVIAAFDPLNQNFTELLLWTWAGVVVVAEAEPAASRVRYPASRRHSPNPSACTVARTHA